MNNIQRAQAIAAEVIAEDEWADDLPGGMEEFRRRVSDPNYQPKVTDHPFVGVAGHDDDDECTDRSDGTDDTYCGRPEHEHTESTR